MLILMLWHGQAIFDRKEASCLPLLDAGFELWKSETPNCQQTECPLTNRLLSRIKLKLDSPSPLLWRHNGHDGDSNHQPHDCLHNCLFRRRSKKTSNFRVTGLCAVNSPGTGEFPAQMASNAENVCIWWRHHAYDERAFSPLDFTII